MIIKEKVKDKVNTKLNRKEWYRLVLDTEGIWNTTLRIPTFDRISLKDKCAVGANTFKLYLNKEEELIFKTVYKNYIISFEKIDHENKEPELKTLVWK